VLTAAATVVLVAGCTSGGQSPPTTELLPTAISSGSTNSNSTPATGLSVEPTTLASDPEPIADDLVSDEQALRDPAAGEPAVSAAAHRQQLAYRAIGRHPEWDEIVRPRIPPPLLDCYDRNVAARRNLNGLANVGDTLPAWRIVPPAPLDELLGNYHDAEAETGVSWTYLAAINLIETGFGRIEGTSTAGAQGPMQFLPATFAAYGRGGDIHSTRDSILTAGRYLAANGFSSNPDNAIYQYNHANQYVQAVKQYAAIFDADPSLLGGYYRWQVYYRTTAGDVLLPEGYSETTRIPVEEYLITHPQQGGR
jgi:hypothetical protein